jgi:hypothetical protein
VGLGNEMSEFNLTIGQTLDLLNKGKKFIGEHNDEIYLWKGSFIAAWYYVCSNSFSCDFVLNEAMLNTKFREYIEPVKIITWYRPTYIWDKNYVHPTINMNKRFFPTQEQASKSLSLTEKIIKWETLEAAETWEQCE